MKSVAIAYRRRRGDSIWHWCRSCSNWPSLLIADESAAQPAQDESCAECAELARTGLCTPNPY